MSSEFWIHLVEIVVLGVPLWFGAMRLYVILGEFPPHLHDSDEGIRYPRGMYPGRYRKTKREHESENGGE